jgi:hypothetical protein
MATRRGDEVAQSLQGERSPLSAGGPGRDRPLWPLSPPQFITSMGLVMLVRISQRVSKSLSKRRLGSMRRNLEQILDRTNSQSPVNRLLHTARRRSTSGNVLEQALVGARWPRCTSLRLSTGSQTMALT